MFKRYTLIVFLIVFSVFPLHHSHAQTSNVGFVPANIWYSKDPFEEGDIVKIYTVIFNPDSRQLSGTVEFFDDVLLLGKKDFKVEAKGVKDVFIDWEVGLGEHIIFGRIKNAKFLMPDGKYEEVSLGENQTEKSLRTVNKKIFPANVVEENNANLPSLDKITEFVNGKIPQFVSLPFISTLNYLEKFRDGVVKKSEIKKEIIGDEIKVIDDNALSDVDQNKNQLLRPFKYAELLFFTLSLWIFNNKLIFYLTIIFVFFLLIRFIWKLFF